MSRLPYTGESQRDEHDPATNTKKVMLYGWDVENLQAVRLAVTPEGQLMTASNAQLVVIEGDGTDQATEINAALLANQGATVYLTGEITIGSPLRIPSFTTLNAYGAIITLSAHSGDTGVNAVQNYAVQENRRCVDGSITSGDATFTSATASFISSDVGKSIRIYYDYNTTTKKIEWLDTTIASVTNSTTIELAATPTKTATNRYFYIGDRDRNVRVVGGRWIREAPNGAGGSHGWDSNHFRFRHVDFLEVGDIDVYVKEASNSKYAVNAGDCYIWNIHDITTQHVHSDLIHINGPALWGNITRISSKGGGDDVVSLTGGDFRNEMQWMGDTLGSITDVIVDGVRSEPSYDNGDGDDVGGISRGVLLLAGQNDGLEPYWVDRISVFNVNTQLENYPVFIGEDDQDTHTTGGSWGRILIDGIVNNNQDPPGAAVRVAANAEVEDLEIRSVIDIGGNAYIWIENGATVDRMIVSGVPQEEVAIDGTVTDKLIVDNFAALAVAQTFTKQQTFYDSNGSEAIKADHIRVYPKSSGGSASIFLDNENSGIFEFFCNNGGQFGVYDAAYGKQPLTLAANQTASVKLENNKWYVQNGGLDVSGDGDFHGAYLYNVNQFNPNSNNTGSIGLSDYRYNTAYINNVVLAPSSSATPTTNGDLVIEKTSNTSVTLKLKGSDGVVRSVSLTLT